MQQLASITLTTYPKKPVQITNRLGHSMTYDKVMEIKTAQAQRSQKLLDYAGLSVLPLQPATENDSVLTIFWTTLIKYFC